MRGRAISDSANESQGSVVSDFCHLFVSGDAVNGGTGHADTLSGKGEEVEVVEEVEKEEVEKEEVEDRGGTPRAEEMEERI